MKVESVVLLMYPDITGIFRVRRYFLIIWHRERKLWFLKLKYWTLKASLVFVQWSNRITFIFSKFVWSLFLVYEDRWWICVHWEKGEVLLCLWLLGSRCHLQIIYTYLLGYINMFYIHCLFWCETFDACNLFAVKHFELHLKCY